MPADDTAPDSAVAPPHDRHVPPAGDRPSLTVALAALMGMQIVITGTQFAPGILAPKLGLTTDMVGLFSMVGFLVAMGTALSGGLLVARVGSFRMGALCLVTLSLGIVMLLAGGGTVGLITAGILVGLAFGPETPASAAILAKITTPAQRPLVFSVRQTGNQIGAALGSLALPPLALIAPLAGLWLLLAAALAMALWLFVLGRRYDHLTRGATRPFDIAGAFRLIAGTPALKALALASIGFGAVQLALNAFFVTFAVRELALSHIASGQLLAVAQIGGLVGRLGAGVVATRWLSPLGVLISLGGVMAASTVVTALAGHHLPVAALVPLMFVFGMSASGWNGLFFAEVTRLAPADRAAEATGTILATCFSGVVLSSLLGGQIGASAGLGLVFASLGLVALAATLPLVLLMRAERAPHRRVQ